MKYSFTYQENNGLMYIKEKKGDGEKTQERSVIRGFERRSFAALGSVMIGVMLLTYMGTAIYWRDHAEDAGGSGIGSVYKLIATGIYEPKDNFQYDDAVFVSAGVIRNDEEAEHRAHIEELAKKYIEDQMNAENDGPGEAD